MGDIGKKRRAYELAIRGFEQQHEEAERAVERIDNQLAETHKRQLDLEAEKAGVHRDLEIIEEAIRDSRIRLQALEAPITEAIEGTGPVEVAAAPRSRGEGYATRRAAILTAARRANGGWFKAADVEGRDDNPAWSKVLADLADSSVLEAEGETKARHYRLLRDPEVQVAPAETAEERAERIREARAAGLLK